MDEAMMRAMAAAPYRLMASMARSQAALLKGQAESLEAAAGRLERGEELPVLRAVPGTAPPSAEEDDPALGLERRPRESEEDFEARKRAVREREAERAERERTEQSGDRGKGGDGRG